MKLLEKQQVNTQKAKERKLEIDEGAKLAKKIDILRETFSKEQTNLLKFRDESLENIRKEIELGIEKKNQLYREITEAEERKKTLLLPLDKEFDQIEMSKSLLQQRIEEFEIKENIILQRENSLESKERELISGRNDLAETKEIISKTLLEATRTKELADSRLKDIERKGKDNILAFIQREKDLDQKEEAVLYREVDLNNGLEQLKKDRENIIRQKIALEDREKTLEREFKRLKS